MINVVFSHSGTLHSKKMEWTTCTQQIIWVHSPLSCVWLFAAPWTVACQAPVSMEFSRQEYWSGLPCPPPGDLPNPGIKPPSLVSSAWPGRFFTTSATWEALMNDVCVCVCVCAHVRTLIRVQLFATPWTIACQAPVSMGFLRHKYQNEFLFPFPGDLSHPGIKPASFSSSALAGRFFATAPWGKSLEWEGWISKTVLESQARAFHSCEILLGQEKRWWWT